MTHLYWIWLRPQRNSRRRYHEMKTRIVKIELSWLSAPQVLCFASCRRLRYYRVRNTRAVRFSDIKLKGEIVDKNLHLQLNKWKRGKCLRNELLIKWWCIDSGLVSLSVCGVFLSEWKIQRGRSQVLLLSHWRANIFGGFLGVAGNVKLTKIFKFRRRTTNITSVTGWERIFDITIVQNSLNFIYKTIFILYKKEQKKQLY